MGDEREAKTYRIRSFVIGLIEQMAKQNKVPNGDIIEEAIIFYSKNHGKDIR